MPSNVVHCYFAQRVYDSLNQDIKSIIDQDKQAFLLGSQGPDLLFYMRFEKPPLNKLGEMLHNSFDTANIMRQSALYAASKDTQTMLPFIFGQLCHYALDSEMHPYVYHRELDLPAYYPKSAAKYIHVLFESGLDYICVRDYLKHSTKFYKSYKNLNIAESSRKAVARYYSNLVAPIFGIDLLPQTAERAIKLMRIYYRLVDDITGVKYVFVRAIERMLGSPQAVSAFFRPRKERKQEDWLNFNRKPFPKYRNKLETTTQTVQELAAQAHAKALDLIYNLSGVVTGDAELNEALYTRNYSGDIKD